MAIGGSLNVSFTGPHGVPHAAQARSAWVKTLSSIGGQGRAVAEAKPGCGLSLLVYETGGQRDVGDFPRERRWV
jgi:hypothetical protein